MSTWQIGYEECLRNVDQYIQDARILIDRKSYGHAFSLAILAKEELAKATGYFMILSGILDANTKAGKKFLKLLHRIHELKIGFASMLLFAPEVISKLKDSVPEVVKEQIKHAKDKGELVRRTYESLFDSPVALPFFGTISEHVKKGGEIQRLKLRGLYVDIDESGRVVTPNKITEDEAVTQLKELVENRKIIGGLPVLLNQVSSQDSLIFKEVMRELTWKPIAEVLEKSKKF